MPKITILLGKEENNKTFSISFTPGKSLRAILNLTKYRVHTGCVGNGACGLCLVRIKTGIADEPTLNETLQLNKSQIESGIRLACLVIPKNDLQVEIINKIPESEWKVLPKEKYASYTIKKDLLKDITQEKYYLTEHIKEPCGLAIDLGTTSINLILYDLSSGNIITARQGLNPQHKFGSDVLTRVILASKSIESANEMKLVIIEAIKKVLEDIAVSERIILMQITHVIFVGNTAMLALLTGHNFKRLIDPNYWMKPIDLQLPDISDWVSHWKIFPQAKIEIIQPISGFVGSDLTAGILSTSLIEQERGTLLIDFGTNTEIALWDGAILWVTSASGGPAFEGSGISCGMSAESGAIYRINSMKNEDLDFDVINGGKAYGICGSGLIDIISKLIIDAKLTNIGRFTNDIPKTGFNLLENKIVLTEKDVDVIQRAKSGIATALKVVLKRANIEPSKLAQVYICGLFGYFLNLENAKNIGLLPHIDEKRFKLCGNTAITGCGQILLSKKAKEDIKKIKSRIRIINLANCEEFDELFIENLYLTKMK